MFQPQKAPDYLQREVEIQVGYQQSKLLSTELSSPIIEERLMQDTEAPEANPRPTG